MVRAGKPPCYDDGVVNLNGFEPADVAAHLAGEDEETARRFGWWPRASNEQTVQRAIAEWTESWAKDGDIQTFAVRRETTGELIGGCQLRRQPDGCGHVSYWTASEWRQNGFARRALRLLCGHANAIGVAGLEAHIAADNAASRAVAESAGFTLADLFADDDDILMTRYIWRGPGTAAEGR